MVVYIDTTNQLIVMHITDKLWLLSIRASTFFIVSYSVAFGYARVAVGFVVAATHRGIHAVASRGAGFLYAAGLFATAAIHGRKAYKG